MNERTVLLPIRESARDLIYSEKASLKRSLHVLIQDRGIERYKPLLKIYRKIISDYISFSNIESLSSLVGNMVSYADEVSREENLSTEDITKMSIFVMLNSGTEIFILTTSAESVFIGRKGEWEPLAQAGNCEPIKLPLYHPESQRELFSNRLSDFLRLFNLELPNKEELQVIAGVKESDLEDILKLVRDSGGEIESGQCGRRRGVELANLANKGLMVSVSRSSSFLSLADTVSVAADYGGASHRTIPIILLAVIAAISILASGFLVFRHNESKENMDISSEASFQTGNLHEEPLISNMEREKTDNYSKEEAMPVGLVEKWRHLFKMPVTSSPVLSGRTVLFGCRDGNLYCMDSESGNIKWNYPSSAGVGASPAIYNDSVICADYGGNVFCLDVRNGARIWAIRLPGKIVSSPVVYAGKVFVGCYDRRIYCLSGKNGEILWKYKTSGLIRATPICSSGIVSFPSYDGYLYGVSIGTGTLHWKYKMGGQLSGSPAADGRVIVAGGTDGRIHALDLAKGRRIWTAKTIGPVKSSILIAGKKVYAGSNDKNFYCLNKSTGSVEWKFTAGDIILSKPFLWRNLLVVASYDKSIYLLDADTGERISSFEAKGSIFSSPFVSRGLIFFGDNEGTFYCLSIREVESS